MAEPSSERPTRQSRTAIETMDIIATELPSLHELRDATGEESETYAADCLRLCTESGLDALDTHAVLLTQGRLALRRDNPRLASFIFRGALSEIEEGYVKRGNAVPYLEAAIGLGFSRARQVSRGELWTCQPLRAGLGRIADMAYRRTLDSTERVEALRVLEQLTYAPTEWGGIQEQADKVRTEILFLMSLDTDAARAQATEEAQERSEQVRHYIRSRDHAMRLAAGGATSEQARERAQREATVAASAARLEAL